MALSSAQRKQIVDALIDAFPHYDALRLMVFMHLGENIETIVSSKNVRDCAFELVVWMDARGRIKELIRRALDVNQTNPLLVDCGIDFGVLTARESAILPPLPAGLVAATLRENSRNPRLLDFQKTLGLGWQRGETEVAAHPSVGGLPQQERGPSTTSPLPQPLRTALVDALLRLPGILQFTVRSSLLQALPSIHTLDRNHSNAMQDLVGIVDQLVRLGQTSSRQWSLILLLDTAQEYIRGYALEEDLQQLRQQLVAFYGDA